MIRAQISKNTKAKRAYNASSPAFHNGTARLGNSPPLRDEQKTVFDDSAVSRGQFIARESQHPVESSMDDNQIASDGLFRPPPLRKLGVGTLVSKDTERVQVALDPSRYAALLPHEIDLLLELEGQLSARSIYFQEVNDNSFGKTSALREIGQKRRSIAVEQVCVLFEPRHKGRTEL